MEAVRVKIVAKPIEVLSVMDTKGNITPLRFKMETEDESYRVTKIDKVIDRTQERLAGNNMMVFNCQSLIENIEKRYEIKYEFNTCKWILFKI